MNSTTRMDNVLRSLNSAARNIRLYPPKHPAIEIQISKAYQGIILFLNIDKELFIGRLRDVLVFNDAPILDAEDKMGELMGCMEKKEVEGVIFRHGMCNSELRKFVYLLTDKDAPSGVDLNKMLQEKGAPHISLKSIIFEKRTGIEVYDNAISVIKDMIGDVRMGRIPKSGEVAEVVEDMTDSILVDADVMLGLTKIKSYDNYLYNHSVNVGLLSLALAHYLKTSGEELHIVGMAGILHDVGKTDVAADIIKKPGSLSQEEWEMVQQHPVFGADITRQMPGIEDGICTLILEHHVRYDYSGYPKLGHEYNNLSMIITIADVYDALTTTRVYHQPKHPSKVVTMLNELSGKHFHPDMLRSFVEMIGVYPIGSTVRLSTNEIAVVTKPNPSHTEYPKIKIVCDKDGAVLNSPIEVNLDKDSGDGRFIISPVDPFAAGIDIDSFIQEEIGNNVVE